MHIFLSWSPPSHMHNGVFSSLWCTLCFYLLQLRDYSIPVYKEHFIIFIATLHECGINYISNFLIVGILFWSFANTYDVAIIYAHFIILTFENAVHILGQIHHYMCRIFYISI